MTTNRFDKNNYEFNQDSPLGVYLIHGFSNTTYEVKQLAEFLANNGFHAVANNLPGHGTNIDECNKVKYKDWIDKVTQDVAQLASVSEKIYVVGCSMGAVLTLYLASIFPLNGCVVGGTVLKFRNQLAVNYLVPIIHRIVKTSKKPIKYSPNTKFYGYTAYPLSALNEFRKLSKVVMAKMSEITIPTLIIHSNADYMSSKENMNIVKNAIKSVNKKILVVEKSHHNLFDANPNQSLIFKEVLNFLKN